MVHTADLTVGFLIVSSIVSLGLLIVALRGYGQTHDRQLTFVAIAFGILAVKSMIVAYSLRTAWIEHGSLELLDAVGDMAAVLMFMVPLFMPRR